MFRFIFKATTSTIRSLFQAPFKFEKRLFLFFGFCSLTSAEFRVFICSFLQRELGGLSQTGAFVLVISLALFFLCYIKLRMRKKISTRTLQKFYLWGFGQIRKKKIVKKCQKVALVARHYLNKIALSRFSWKNSHQTLSEETLEKKMLERHYKYIINRHR